ncbi:MAG: hypothetical protein U0I99_05185 [Dialister sp.]|nr:hypothetical protein [Dialister sp.]
MEHTEYIAHLQGIVQIPTVSSVNDASRTGASSTGCTGFCRKPIL